MCGAKTKQGWCAYQHRLYHYTQCLCVVHSKEPQFVPFANETGCPLTQLVGSDVFYSLETANTPCQYALFVCSLTGLL